MRLLLTCAQSGLISMMIAPAAIGCIEQSSLYGNPLLKRLDKKVVFGKNNLITGFFFVEELLKA
jgi:hypothetical protein